MKKYAILQNMGKWEHKDGKRVIHCEVLDTVLVMDSNDYNAIWKAFTEHNKDGLTRYDSNGIWRSWEFSMRARAKKTLEYYAKKNDRQAV